MIRNLEFKVASQQKRIDELEATQEKLYSHTQDLEKALSASGPETVPPSPMGIADELANEDETIPGQTHSAKVTDQQLQEMQARLDRVEQKANADRRNVMEMELSHGGPL